MAFKSLKQKASAITVTNAHGPSTKPTASCSLLTVTRSAINNGHGRILMINRSSYPGTGKLMDTLNLFFSIFEKTALFLKVKNGRTIMMGSSNFNFKGH